MRAILEKGDKVHYTSPHGNKENGIVKEVRKNIAFVVFHCADELDNYQNYTGQAVSIDDLTLGWVTKKHNNSSTNYENSKHLWENKESMEKYISRLKELMEKEESQSTKIGEESIDELLKQSGNILAELKSLNNKRSVKTSCCFKKRKATQCTYWDGYDSSGFKCKHGYGCKKTLKPKP